MNFINTCNLIFVKLIVLHCNFKAFHLHFYIAFTVCDINDIAYSTNRKQNSYARNIRQKIKNCKIRKLSPTMAPTKKGKVAFKCPKVTSKQVFVIRKAICFSFFDRFQQYTRFDIC